MRKSKESTEHKYFPYFPFCHVEMNFPQRNVSKCQAHGNFGAVHLLQPFVLATPLKEKYKIGSPEKRKKKKKTVTHYQYMILT